MPKNNNQNETKTTTTTTAAATPGRATTATEHLQQPVFIPHRQHSSSGSVPEDKCLTFQNVKFEEREIRLLPSRLTNGFIHKKRNSIQPLLETTTIKADIHHHPFQYISPSKESTESDCESSDVKNMTVYSIFRRNSNSSTKLNITNNNNDTNTNNNNHNDDDVRDNTRPSQPTSTPSTPPQQPPTSLSNGFVPNGYPSLDSSLPPPPNQDGPNDEISIAMEKDDQQSINNDESEEESTKKDQEEDGKDESNETAVCRLQTVPEGEELVSVRPLRSDEKTGEQREGKKQVVITSLTGRSVAVRPTISRAPSTDTIIQASSYRLTDLRRMLQPQEEVKDLESILKAHWESVLDCQCFEWNFNNAAKLVTIAVLILTIVMIINTYSKGGR